MCKPSINETQWKMISGPMNKQEFIRKDLNKKKTLSILGKTIQIEISDIKFYSFKNVYLKRKGSTIRWEKISAIYISHKRTACKIISHRTL